MAQLLLAIGASAGTVSTIGSIATIASPVLGVMSALSSMSAAKQQKAEHQREATERRVMAGVEAEQARKKARFMQSRDRASMAEAGAMSGTGLDVLDQNAVAQELDALNVEFRGEQAARGADFRASQSKSSVLNVFSAAVGGFTQMDPLNLTPKGQFVGVS